MGFVRNFQNSFFSLLSILVGALVDVVCVAGLIPAQIFIWPSCNFSRFGLFGCESKCV